MSSDLEHQLRAEMEHFTADVWMPHGLAARAYRNHRRQRVLTSRVTAVGAAAALAAAGTSYGLTAAHDGGGARSAGGGKRPATAGLTAVRGCPGTYVVAGTLTQVSGTQATIHPFDNQPVTVDTSASTAISSPVSGSVSDITDGSQVFVYGTWSGGNLVADQVGIQDFTAESFEPRAGLPHLPAPRRWPPFAHGKVVAVSGGNFTVAAYYPATGTRPVQVVTTSSTEVQTEASGSLSQLAVEGDAVAIGQIGADGALTATSVSEPAFAHIATDGTVEIRSQGCSASAITAAVLAGD
jgi:hypothetical protein